MRLFIAIELPEEVRDYLFGIKEEFNRDLAKVNWVAKSKIHLTLKFLGNVDEKIIPRIIGKLKEIKFDSFELELDNFSAFPNENNIRVLWVGVMNFNKVIELQQEIEDQLRDYFEKDREFSAHITLGRVKTIKAKNEFKEVFKKIKIQKMKFTVNSFSLIQSQLSRAGPKYSNVEKFQSS